jgi:hypothetical protein
MKPLRRAGETENAHRGKLAGELLVENKACRGGSERGWLP